MIPQHVPSPSGWVHPDADNLSSHLTPPLKAILKHESPSSPKDLRGGPGSVPPTAPRPACTFSDCEKLHDHVAPSTRRLSTSSREVPFAEILSRDEDVISRYGGNDVEDPLPMDAISRTLSRRTTVPVTGDEKAPNLVDWDGPDDQENPKNWSRGYKWLITFLCILMSINVTFASSAPSSAVGDLIRQFHVSRTVAELVTTTFLLGYCVGPLFWGPGSELFGRRPVFVIAMSCYTLLILGQALAQNIQTLMITRFLSGFFACAPLTNSGGVMADMWDAETRGLAVSLFSASVFLGPVLGPVVSGYIVESYLSWRWVFWVMMIFAGACTVITIPVFPETCAPVILLRKARRLREGDPEKNGKLYAEHENQDWSLRGVVHRTLLRPFKMLFVEPILLLVTIYLSMIYGLLYALFSAFPVIFVTVRGFTISQTGLIFIGVGIGTSIGSLINVLASMHYPELIKKWRGFPPPEHRLFGAMIGSPILVIGAFWLGWTGEYATIGWYVPALATIVIGAGISSIFMSFLTYLVDTYLMYSASALAANTIVRSAVASGFPLFTSQMFTNLGINWACTVIGLVSLLFMPSPFLFYKYGARIRAKSKFAPCLDLVIAKKMEEEEKNVSASSSFTAV